MNFEKMNITAFAKVCGVTPRTLKHYEACGLLRPASVGENGYREYTISQSDRVSAILLLRDHGFSLAEIRTMLSHSDLESLIEQMDLQKKILEEQKARLTRQERYIDYTYTHLNKAVLHGEEPFVEDIAPRRIEMKLYDQKPKAVIVNYITDGLQSGALFNPESFLFEGVCHTVETGGTLLSGNRLSVYTRCMPPDGKHAMRRLVDAFARRTDAPPGLIYSETVLDELSGGDGLMLYFLMLPE